MPFCTTTQRVFRLTERQRHLSRGPGREPAQQVDDECLDVVPAGPGDLRRHALGVQERRERSGTLEVGRDRPRSGVGGLQVAAEGVDGGGDVSYNGRHGTRRPPASYLQRAAGNPPGSTRRRQRCTDCASMELASYRIGLAATRPTWNTIGPNGWACRLGDPAGNRKAPLAWHLPPARFSIVLDGPASEEVGDRPLRGPAHARDPRSEEHRDGAQSRNSGLYVGVSQLVRHDRFKSSEVPGGRFGLGPGRCHGAVSWRPVAHP